MQPDELSVRLAVLIPLFIISFQVYLLRRILRTAAWSYLTTGFGIFVGVRIATILISPFPIIPALIIYLFGYGFIAFGFFTLRNDLIRVIRKVGSSAPLTGD